MSEDKEIIDFVREAEKQNPLERRESGVDVDLAYWVTGDFVKRAAIIEKYTGLQKARAGSMLMGDLSNVLWAMSANLDANDPDQKQLFDAWDESIKDKLTISKLTSKKGFGLDKDEAVIVNGLVAGSVTTNTFTHLLNGVTGREFSPSMIVSDDVKDLLAVDLVIKDKEKKTISVVQLKTTRHSDPNNVNVWRVEEGDNYNASYWSYLNSKEDLDKMQRVAKRLGEVNPGYRVENYVVTVPTYNDPQINNIFGIPAANSEVVEDFRIAAFREGLIDRKGVRPNAA